MKTSILLSTLLALLACGRPARAQGGEEDSRPGWLKGVSAEYPRDAYICGVGVGNSAEQAADKARSEVSKYFGTKLVARSESSMRETNTSSTQEVSDEVKTFTSQILEGVEVSKYWTDKDGLVYALAALNREQALKTATGKLEEIDRNFLQKKELLEKTEGKFARLKYALDLVKYAKYRKEFNKQYRILHPSGKGMPGPEAEDALAQARKAIRAITIQVEASGDNVDAVALNIRNDLTGYGLRATSGGDKTPDILVEVHAKARSLPPENLLWYWAKGTIVVQMSYGSTGEVFARFEQSAQKESNNPGSAVDVTLQTLAGMASAGARRVILTQDLADD